MSSSLITPQSLKGHQTLKDITISKDIEEEEANSFANISAATTASRAEAKPF
jgi:hypothetical protein